MKDVSQRIRNLPALCQKRLHVEMIVALEQIVEKQSVNTLGLGIYADARIKIRRAALDDHDQRVGIGLRCARKQGKERRYYQHKKAQATVALTHKKSFREWPASLRRSRIEGWTGAGSRFRTPARRRQRLLSLRMARRTRPTNAVEAPAV